MTQNKPFDPTKPVQTREGRAARIICDDVKSNNESFLVFLITYSDGVELPFKYCLNGQRFKGISSGCDLINVPVKRKGWVNIYKGKDSGYTYCLSSSKSMARALCASKRIACKEIEFEEGEGLDE